MALLLSLLVSTSACVQPAGPTTSSAASDGKLTVSCIPADKPCLAYKLRVADLTATRGGISILFQGSPTEGVPSKAVFEGMCDNDGSAYSICSLHQPISITITSNCQNCPGQADGRSLKVSWVTQRLERAYAADGLTQAEPPAKGASDFEAPLFSADQYCFKSEENTVLYDGHSLSVDQFHICRDDLD